MDRPWPCSPTARRASSGSRSHVMRTAWHSCVAFSLMQAGTAVACHVGRPGSLRAVLGATWEPLGPSWTLRRPAAAAPVAAQQSWALRRFAAATRVSAGPCSRRPCTAVDARVLGRRYGTPALGVAFRPSWHILSVISPKNLRHSAATILRCRVDRIAVGSASGAGGLRRDERRRDADVRGGAAARCRRPQRKHDVLGHHRLVQRHGHVHQHIPRPDQLGEYHWDQRHVADDVHGGSVDYSSSARAA